MLMTTQLFDNTNKLHLGICKDQPLHISEALALHNQVTGELYDGQCGVVDLPPHHILDLKIYTTGKLVLVVEKVEVVRKLLELGLWCGVWWYVWHFIPNLIFAGRSEQMVWDTLYDNNGDQWKAIQQLKGFKGIHNKAHVHEGQEGTEDHQLHCGWQ